VRQTMEIQNSKNSDALNKNADYHVEKQNNVSSKMKRSEMIKHSLTPETIMIAGRARLPEGVTAKQVFGCLTIELEIDPADSVIVDFACTLVPHLGEKILHNALLGSNVEEGIEEAIIQLKKRFFNTTKRAVIAALEDAHRWYKKYLKIANQDSQ
jgi:hypothetical protein